MLYVASAKTTPRPFIDVIDEARFTLPYHRDAPLTDLDIHTRYWMRSNFCHKSGRNASSHYTGFAAATHSFQEP